MGLTSTNMIHKPRGQNYNRQEHRVSMSDYLTLVLKKILLKSNHQESIGSTNDCLAIILKKIRHIRTQNKIEAPFINDT